MENSYIYKKPGLWHVLTSQHSNDCAQIREIYKDVFVVCLSDGSSSSLLRKQAATTACKATVDFFTENFSCKIFSAENNLSAELVEYVKNQLEQLTDSYCLKAEDADCTLLAVVFSKKENKCVYYSVGTDYMWLNREMVVGSPPSESRHNTVSNLQYIHSATLEAFPQDIVIMASDGRFPHIYSNESLKNEITDITATRDFSKRKYFLDQLTPLDDCTVIFFEC